MTSGDATRYTSKGSPRIDLLNTGGWDNVFLTALNAFSHVSFHENFSTFFVRFRICFILFANLGINLNNDFNLHTSRWTSFRLFGLLVVSKAWHLSKFSSTSRLVSMKTKNLPPSTPNTHFSGLCHMLYLLSWPKISVRSATCSSELSDFTIISSTYTSTIFPICSRNIQSINLW